MGKNNNPKGFPETLTAPRFQKGQSGNPGGKPREVIQAERRAAANAALARDKLLQALADKLSEADSKDEILAALCADVRGLISEASDRAYGKPEQTNNNNHAVSDPLAELMMHVAEKSGRIGDD